MECSGEAPEPMSPVTADALARQVRGSSPHCSNNHSSSAEIFLRPRQLPAFCGRSAPVFNLCDWALFGFEAIRPVCLCAQNSLFPGNRRLVRQGWSHLVSSFAPPCSWWTSRLLQRRSALITIASPMDGSPLRGGLASQRFLLVRIKRDLCQNEPGLQPPIARKRLT